MTAPRQPPFAPMESAYLDTVRFLLAMAVVIAHVSEPVFNTSIGTKLTHWGLAAVGGFFVLSGYTISAILASNPASGPGAFVAERFTRLQSVALPALLLTVLLDMVSMWMAPDFYAKWETPQVGIKVLANVLLFGQSWGYDLPPLSNSPFWSLSYEAGFYALFAASWLALSAPRRGGAALVLVALALGPQIVTGFLLWLSGLFLYKVTRPAKPWLGALSVSLVFGVLLFAQALAPIAWPDWRTPHDLISGAFRLLHTPTARLAPQILTGMFAFVGLHAVLLRLLHVLTPPPTRPNRTPAGRTDLPFVPAALPHHGVHESVGRLAGSQRAGRWPRGAAVHGCSTHGPGTERRLEALDAQCVAQTGCGASTMNTPGAPTAVFGQHEFIYFQF